MMDQTQEFTMQAPQQVFQLSNLWSIFNALLSYDVNLDFHYFVDKCLLSL